MSGFILLSYFTASFVLASDHTWAHRYLQSICEKIPEALAEDRSIESLFVQGAISEEAALDLLRDYKILGRPLNRAIGAVFRRHKLSFASKHDFSRTKKEAAQARVDAALADAKGFLALPEFELDTYVAEVLSELKKKQDVFLGDLKLQNDEGLRVSALYVEKAMRLLSSIDGVRTNGSWRAVFHGLLRVRVIKLLDEFTVLPQKDEAFRGSETLTSLKLTPLVGALTYLRIYVNTIPGVRYFSSRSAVQWGFDLRKESLKAMVSPRIGDASRYEKGVIEDSAKPILFGLKYIGHFALHLKDMSPVELSTLGLMEWTKIEPLFQAITLGQRQDESFLLSMREAAADLRFAPFLFEYQENFKKQVNLLSAALPSDSLLGTHGELNQLFSELRRFESELKSLLRQIEPYAPGGEFSREIDPEFRLKADGAVRILSRYLILTRRLLTKESQVRLQAKAFVDLLQHLRRKVPAEFHTEQDWLSFAVVFEQVLNSVTLQPVIPLYPSQP